MGKENNMSQMAKLEFSVSPDTAEEYNRTPQRKRLRIQNNIDQVIRFSVAEVNREQTDKEAASELIQAFKNCAEEAQRRGAPKTEEEIQNIIENS